MRYLPRTLEKEVTKALQGFPAIIITGPRRAGKTCMLRHMFPAADYRLLEDPEIIGRVRSDPRGFLEELKPPVILDEIQNTPELFAYIRAKIDVQPQQMGRWLITGSQEAPLMQRVTESMAGRAAVFQLLPFSTSECPRASVLHGAYPEVLARPQHAQQWFSAYVQAYLERDVRAITAVKDLTTFRRFMALLASRHGQMLNKTDLAAPLGVSVPTITHWLNILEMTSQIFVIPPFFENFGKRLVKSPKIYLADSGLACYLLGIETNYALEKSPFAGVLFEGFIAAEVIKHQTNTGKRRELYYFRDEQGHEVDFIFPNRDNTWTLAECKSTKTVAPDMAKPLQYLAKAFNEKNDNFLKIRSFVVHQPAKSPAGTTAVLPGIEALSWPEFLKQLS